MAVTHQHVLLLALLLGLPTVAPAAQGPAGTATVPRFEPAPCTKLLEAEEPAKASCVVPQYCSKSTGRTIRLMVAKYPARSPEKRTHPIVHLTGVSDDIAPLEVNELIAADFTRDRSTNIINCCETESVSV
jgi:hypothetical protein